jgi:hypothetical protein
MTWSFILHVFLAGLCTYVFLRACGLGFFGALAGGLAYMIGGNVAGLVSPGHDGKLYISALLPLTLLLVLRGVHDGKRWAWGALAVVVGLAVLSPHPQLLQYLLLVAGAFGVYIAFAEFGGVKLDRSVALRRLGLAAAAVAIGGAIGAIQYVPVREYVPFSPRAGGKGWEHAVSYSMPPEELLNTYLPQFTGMLDRYWGRNGHGPDIAGCPLLTPFGPPYLQANGAHSKMRHTSTRPPWEAVHEATGIHCPVRAPQSLWA